MQEFSSKLDEILVAVANGKLRHPDEELTAFYPVKGKKAVGDLMVVGRAVNRWGDGWLPEEARDSLERQGIIGKALPGYFWKEKCPMLWISRWWSKTGYWCLDCGAEAEDPSKIQHCPSCQKNQVEKIPNPAKLALLRVMRSVTIGLKIADIQDWSSYLMWTELYKVAPAAGGNPSSSLQKMQRKPCIEMLRQEVQQWQPRRVLFLTGYDYWAEPFLSGIGVTDGKRLEGLVEYVGRIPLGSSTATVVVAPHPQSRSEQPIVDAIQLAFQNQGS